MSKKKVVNEINYIRAFACLSIVFIHAVTVAINSVAISGELRSWMQTFQVALMFATPLFILISEFLLAYAYPKQVPKNFFAKRIHYILLPYISIGLIYGLFDIWYAGGSLSLAGYWDKVWNILVLGSWYGYFVLIIFQFYILHKLFAKHLYKANPLMILSISFLVNAAYLSIFYFMDPVAGISERFWERHSIIPFPGWVFYFTAAYYAGKNFDQVKGWLQKNIVWVTAGGAGLLMFLVFNHRAGIVTDVSSKRVDLLLYTCVVMALLYYVFTKIKPFPKWAVLISNYSFSIYLIHFMILRAIRKLTDQSVDMNLAVYTLLLFFVGVIGSIVIAYMMNKLPFGSYVVGKVNRIKYTPPVQREELQKPKAS